VSEWLSQRRRKAAVRKRTGTTDPPEVTHALDFFIWAALDDQELGPMEARPFGDDERHYNAILNRYLDYDVPSTAEMSQPRLEQERRAERPEGASYLPHYFPDQDWYLNAALAVAKHAFVLQRLFNQSDTLKGVAKAGRALDAPPTLPSTEVLINPEAYTAYYLHLRDTGRRFADALPEEREAACVSAMKSAVVAAGDAEGGIANPDGWVAVSPALAREVIADFLDPEGLLL
jgi:hypothetical protein